MKCFLLAVLSIALIALCPPMVRADTVNTLTLSLDQATFDVAPGDQFVVSGSLMQTNPDTTTLDNPFLAPQPVSICATLLLCASFDPAFTAFFGHPSSALTLYTGPMIDIAVASNALPGSVTFELSTAISDAGPSSGLVGPGSSLFTVNIHPPTLPEPATPWLILAGVALLVIGTPSRARDSG